MALKLLFIGTTELLLISGLALLLFGGKKLPEMMKGLGQGVQSFKKGMKEPLEEETEEAESEQENVEGEKKAKPEDKDKQ
ncbi:MAG: twin-arginine translocase TatA/TatE family subunit [Bacteroidaceae bacterium]|nr:twin-arginine translocase TatA/TatE family subunit [Bacteroidaceae bacterium]